MVEPLFGDVKGRALISSLSFAHPDRLARLMLRLPSLSLALLSGGYRHLLGQPTVGSY